MTTNKVVEADMNLLKNMCILEEKDKPKTSSSHKSGASSQRSNPFAVVKSQNEGDPPNETDKKLSQKFTEFSASKLEDKVVSKLASPVLTSFKPTFGNSSTTTKSPISQSVTPDQKNKS